MAFRKPGALFCWTLSLLSPLIFLTVARMAWVCYSAENSSDCYYHAAMALLGPEYFADKTFPHLTMSVWSNQFSDKELGYHFVLWAIFRCGELIGFTGDPPFHLPALVMACGFLVSFSIVCLYFRLRPLWFYMALPVVLSPMFTYRLLMLRPHVMGMILMTFSCLVFAWTRSYRRLWAPALMGFLMAWCYSNPHFILLPAIAFGCAVGLKRPGLGLGMIVSAVVGVVLGFVIHPQFPNTFINWKIQCVDVYREMLVGGAPVMLGDELYQNGLSQIWMSFGFFVFALVNIALFIAIWWRRRWRFWKLPPTLLAMSGLAVATAVGVLIRARALEYAVPFNALALGVLTRYAWRTRRIRPSATARFGWRVGAGGCVAALGAYVIIFYSIYPVARYQPYTHFAKWARTRPIPPGSIIANVFWADFPRLMYSAPEYRFLYGLDPMFGYFSAPERVGKIERFRLGKLKLTPKELRALVNTPFVFVPTRAWTLARGMAKRGFPIIYQGDDGWLFYLDDRPRRKPAPPEPDVTTDAVKKIKKEER